MRRSSGCPGKAADKVHLVGNPVREEVLALRDQPFPALTEDGIFRLLVIGGSQGASILSDVVPEGLALLPEHFRRRLQVTQQCREEDIDRVRARYQALGIPADLATYMEDLPERLGWSHLIIARSGASTIAELTAAGRPAMLVPLPSATDDHQTFNAKEMARAGGARLIPQPKFTPVELAKQMQKLGLEPGALANAAERAKQAGRPERGEGPGRPRRADRTRSRRRSQFRARECVAAAARSGAGMKGSGIDIGTIHFVGIGGIGMSGIAEVMKILGYSVQGSDIAEGYVVEGLRKKGIPVAIGHSPDNLGDAAVVVISTAVKKTNPEVVSAYERRIPVVRRAEMLAELMRLKFNIAVAGTHGKTTTTSMIAAMLDAGGIDPTVINGGIINAYGSNARLGKSDWMVVEADESDGSFLRLDGTIAVVTNIDPEHLDHYGGFEQVKDAFVEFVENVPFYGAALLCVDHPEVQSIIPRLQGPARRHLRLRRPCRRARRQRPAGARRQHLRRVPARPPR